MEYGKFARVSGDSCAPFTSVEEAAIKFGRDDGISQYHLDMIQADTIANRYMLDPVETLQKVKDGEIPYDLLRMINVAGMYGTKMKGQGDRG